VAAGIKSEVAQIHFHDTTRHGGIGDQATQQRCKLAVTGVQAASSGIRIQWPRSHHTVRGSISIGDLDRSHVGCASFPVLVFGAPVASGEPLFHLYGGAGRETISGFWKQ
jgi:hypothetical protein